MIVLLVAGLGVRGAACGEEGAVTHELQTRGENGRWVLERRCRRCGLTESVHCDMDEPGLDHPADCELVHHTFRPATASEPEPEGER